MHGDFTHASSLYRGVPTVNRGRLYSVFANCHVPFTGRLPLKLIHPMLKVFAEFPEGLVV